MAVEAFDVTMVASMSDAVDRSLKKWRVALQDLSNLATDTAFGVHHPIYIATNATVKLYEATFHTLLAQANQVQLTQETLSTIAVDSSDVEASEENFCEDSGSEDEEE